MVQSDSSGMLHGSSAHQHTPTLTLSDNVFAHEQLRLWSLAVTGPSEKTFVHCNCIVLVCHYGEMVRAVSAVDKYQALQDPPH